MNSSNDTLARIVGSFGVVLAVVAIVLAGYAGGSTPAAAGIGGKTSTEGQYIAALGFGVGTEQSFKTVFNSTGQLTMSSVGTAVTGLNFGKCIILPYATTIAASSSAQVDCQASVNSLAPLPGITINDTVFASLSTSSSNTFGGLSVDEVSASSTAGYISMRITNLTGGTFTWTATATTGISYFALR